MRQLKRIAFKQNAMLKRLIVLLKKKKHPLAHMGSIELHLQCKGNSLAWLATVQKEGGKKNKKKEKWKKNQ